MRCTWLFGLWWNLLSSNIRDDAVRIVMRITIVAEGFLSIVTEHGAGLQKHWWRVSLGSGEGDAANTHGQAS